MRRASPNCDRNRVFEQEQFAQFIISRCLNPEGPPFAEHRRRELPKGVSASELAGKQEGIRKAYDELRANIEAALPILVKHAADQRYSYVYEDPWGTSEVYLKATAGHACREIIRDQVEIYHRCILKTTDEKCPRSLWFISDCGGVEKWWSSRTDNTLAELQLEAIDWAMSQKQPAFFQSQAEWTAALNRLAGLAKEIRTSKRPIQVNHKLEFFSK